MHRSRWFAEVIFAAGAREPGFRAAIDPFDGETLLPSDGVGAGDADQQLVVFGLEQLLPGPSFLGNHRRAGLDGIAREVLDPVQALQECGDLLQIQVLRIA
ncbi:hypothetical protein D3C87_1743850 [compost metagenome]